MQIFFTIFAVLSATTASATSILLPLYLYPSPLGWWDSVYDAIAAHPSVDFQIILNPDSGPGGSTPGYNSDWITATSKLHSYDNVETYGYVPINYGARTLADTTTDIENWNGWNNYTAADISVDGLFFDETPNWMGARGVDDVSFMEQLVQLADQGGYRKIFNIGQASNHDEYFSIADTVVIFEGVAMLYKNAVLNVVAADGLTGKSSVLIHHFDGSRLTTRWAMNWMTNMLERNLSSFVIVNTDWSNANSDDAPMGIGMLADMLESIQG
ncbi:hypothetical protein N8I77_003138 [Diaporthe amygdali]|uniref:Spherulin-4 n=1 Tax=Phomopsis amygdali TaxID=1214568 RepID=A0AAD9SHD7_PHOAM|nr:hypothetical protein N8I77_003138 [Diaporthe amygdali]